MKLTFGKVRRTKGHYAMCFMDVLVDGEIVTTYQGDTVGPDYRKRTMWQEENRCFPYEIFRSVNAIKKHVRFHFAAMTDKEKEHLVSGFTKTQYAIR